MQQIPTEWEQDVADLYVNKRPLVKPNTNIKTALISAALFVLATGVAVGFAHYVLVTVGIVAYLPSVARDFYEVHPLWAIVVLCMMVIAIESFFCFKYAVIGAIQLYQHYAPEEIRRRCLFMPTCSEYAIMAVRKYGGVIGLYKSYYRLMYLCKGNIYKINYPWDKPNDKNPKNEIFK